VCSTNVSFGIGQSDLQGTQLVTGEIAAYVGNPVFAFVFSNFIAASPVHILKSHIAAALITVPSVLLKRKNASQGFPVQ
jgi:hypothetical protein